MDKAYIYLARSLIEIALKQMLLNYPKISFLAGWPISLIAIVFSPVLGHLINRSVLNLDFIKIENEVSKDAKQYFEFYKNLKSLDVSQFTETERQAIILKAKNATKRFLSIRQYLK